MMDVDLTSPMVVSVNPTYYCNLRCSFCYLTPEQLADKRRLPLNILRAKLDDIAQHRPIGTFDLYGGEVQLLPDAYIDDVLAVFADYSPETINITTNLTVVKPYLYRDDIDVYVSFDSHHREQWQRTLANARSLTRPFRVILLASKGVIETDVEKIIDELNSMPYLVSVEIKPYSPNQANDHGVLDFEHEHFVWRFIEKQHTLKAVLSNVGLIEEALAQRKVSFTQDHIYLTPQGQYGVLEFDTHDREYFKTFDHYTDYIDWVFEEVQRVSLNAVCSACPHFGHCLSEHLRHEHRDPRSCGGHRNLLQWYQDKYQESVTARPWKDHMVAYNLLPLHHADDITAMTENEGFTFIVSDNDIISDALDYVTQAPKLMRYPAKSYVGGLVYALTIASIYNVDFREVLDDETLFLGSDEHFVPYSQAADTYDLLLFKLNELDDWLSYPWPKRTRNYCLEECTDLGLRRYEEHGRSTR